MTALTLRDKWLAAALPAMVTLLGGWIFVIKPARQELTLTRRRVENQGPISAKLAMAEHANLERQDLERTLASLRSSVPDQATVFDRNLAMQQVSVLCTTHGLNLNATSPEPNGKLSPALQEAAAALGDFPKGTAPQVWRVELSGSYPSMLKLLRDMRNATPTIVPLNLTMEVGDNRRKPTTWILTLWF